MHRLALVMIALAAALIAPRVPAQDAALDALVSVLKSADDAQLQFDILKGMSDGLKGRRSVKMPAGWDEASAKLAKSPNPQVRDLAQALSLTFGSANALTALRAQLVDAAAPVAQRSAALESLLAAKDPALAASLQRLLTEPALRAAAIRGLAAYDDAKSPGALLALYSSLTAAEKRDALGTLVSRAAFARALLDAIAKGAVPAKDLSADLVRQLRNLKQDDITAQVGKLWGVTRESPGEKKKEMARYRALLESKPARADDLSRGRLLYTKTCGQCHMLYGVGGKVGPDITGSNRADLDYLLHNILDPNAEIPNDYRTSNIETKDDRSITGIVTRQDAQSVTVVTPNETLTLPRGDIRTLTASELSMMPEGLLANMTGDEVRDLAAYLRGKSQVPLLATLDTAALFFNGKDLSYWDGDPALWSVEKGELVGKSTGLRRNEFIRSQLLLSDFRLVVKVKLVPNNGNSGIQFRSEVLPNGLMKGCQADVGVGWWGKLYEEHARGLLWDKSGEAHVKAGDWNTYEVLAVGSKVRTAINGKLCVDMDDAQFARSGVIGFQLHSGAIPFEVRYRDFELELNPKFELRTAK
jgi:putative heme-binding domain-containing protein